MTHKQIWTIQWHAAIAEIDRRQWDGLARRQATAVLEWDWLHALEASGSICPDTGWFPRHLTVWRKNTLAAAAAAPLYLKTHSDGEFVFDHGWARLAEQAGMAYYPKLIGMSPATPARGYGFLAAPDEDREAVADTITEAVDRFCLENGVHSSHFHFVDAAWIDSLSRRGYTIWEHPGFQWDNPGLENFDGYLRMFRSGQRRNIRRERGRMHSLGIDIRPLRGERITPDLADCMFRCYLNTNAQYGPWAARFLNKAFFELAFERFRHRLLLFGAFENNHTGDPVALSMLLAKDRHLIGRYWGSRKPIPDLHFNLCFYAPIEWAIEHGIRSFDPGVGSPHKIQRGIRAVAGISLHRFHNPQMQGLFDHFIPEFNTMARSEIAVLNRRLPFSRGAGPPSFDP